MNDPEFYFEIASHAYLIGTILIEAYCLSIWGRSFMSVRAKVWCVSAAYVIAMIVLEYIPVDMSGMTAHLIGIMIAFAVMCLTDRGYVKQKFYLMIAYYCLRWLSWSIISCIGNEMMLVWSALYLRTTEQGIQLWIFNNYWIGQFVLQSITELLIGFLLIYGAVRCMLRVYGNRREHMNNKEFVLLIMPTVLIVGSQGLIRYYLDVYWEHTGWNIYDNYDGYDFYMMFYVLLCYGTILATAYVYRQWKNEQEEDKQREVLSRQMEDMENHIAQVERLYRDIRSLRHDMSNHLMTLESLYSKGEYETAQQYAKTLHEEMQSASLDVNSGNPVTDVILSGRKKEMEDKGIVFDCEFHYPRRGDVNAFDISIILNNALSNAIEAVERERGVREADESERYDTGVIFYAGGARKQESDSDVTHISLAAYLTKNMFIIEIANDYSGELIIDSQSGLPITSKSDGGHGFGLANIRRVVQKYLGDMEIGKETYAGRESCVLRVMLQAAGDSAVD